VAVLPLRIAQGVGHHVLGDGVEVRADTGPVVGLLGPEAPHLLEGQPTDQEGIGGGHLPVQCFGQVRQVGLALPRGGEPVAVAIDDAVHNDVFGHDQFSHAHTDSRRPPNSPGRLAGQAIVGGRSLPRWRYTMRLVKSLLTTALVAKAIQVASRELSKPENQAKLKEGLRKVQRSARGH
jgi:hypothetical protein